MITIEQARSLREAGVVWQPHSGDRFVIDQDGLTEAVFWVSELTISVQSFRDQTLLAFNGTTEWALDSVALGQALWLPREDQLRELLGDRLISLMPTTTGGWSVTYADHDGRTRVAAAADAEQAYASAVLLMDSAADEA